MTANVEPFSSRNSYYLMPSKMQAICHSYADQLLKENCAPLPLTHFWCPSWTSGPEQKMKSTLFCERHLYEPTMKQCDTFSTHSRCYGRYQTFNFQLILLRLKFVLHGQESILKFFVFHFSFVYSFVGWLVGWLLKVLEYTSQFVPSLMRIWDEYPHPNSGVDKVSMRGLNTLVSEKPLFSIWFHFHCCSLLLFFTYSLLLI